MQRLQLRDTALLDLLAVLLWLQHALPFAACVLNCFLLVCVLLRRQRRMRHRAPWPASPTGKNVLLLFYGSMVSICFYYSTRWCFRIHAKPIILFTLAWYVLSMGYVRFELDSVDLFLRCGYHDIIFLDFEHLKGRVTACNTCRSSRILLHLFLS